MKIKDVGTFIVIMLLKIFGMQYTWNEMIRNKLCIIE
jgi:hypothetical protein